MIDYADLRRLAEQAIKPAPTRWWDEQSLAQIQGISPDAAYIAAANPQTILALLDERDHWKRSARHNYSAGKVHVERAQAAERRVAALEELVRAAEVYISHYVPVETARIDGFDPESWAAEARALVAEPRTIRDVRLVEVSVHADGTVGSGYIIEPESEASDE